MGRRVLTVSELTFHERNKPNPASFAPANLKGKDLLDIFHTWASTLSHADTLDKDRETWVSVNSATRFAPRVELLELGVGTYGEPGDVVHIGTGSKISTLTTDHAPTGQNRVLLFVPKRGERAYLLSEESSRGSAGGRILRLFRDYFNNSPDGITLKTAWVTESEAWVNGAEFSEVEVRVEGGHIRDVADGYPVKIGKVSHIARPSRGTRFPHKMMKALHDEARLRRIVAVDDLPDDYQVFIGFERDGRKKKFELGTKGGPLLREVLNDSGQSPLTNLSLLDACASRVSDLCSRTGGKWDRAWSTVQNVNT